MDLCASLCIDGNDHRPVFLRGKLVHRISHSHQFITEHLFLLIIFVIKYFLGNTFHGQIFITVRPVSHDTGGGRITEIYNICSRTVISVFNALQHIYIGQFQHRVLQRIFKIIGTLVIFVIIPMHKIHDFITEFRKFLVTQGIFSKAGILQFFRQPARFVHDVNSVSLGHPFAFSCIKIHISGSIRTYNFLCAD